MASCAIEGCDDPACPVCSVPVRFPQADRIVEPPELKQGAMALNGTKPRPSRDPRTTPRRRKALT
jgi:hypothetical protein